MSRSAVSRAAASMPTRSRVGSGHIARLWNPPTIPPHLCAGPSRPHAPPLIAFRHVIPLRRATTLASSAPDSQHPPVSTKPRIHVKTPDLGRIKEEGYFDDDVQLIPPDQAVLHITPQAVTQLAVITSREPSDTVSKGLLALRIAVESGGCHGYQDTLSLTEERGVDDYVFQPDGVNCIPVVIDLTSLNLLKGSTLHFATELIGSSFRIQDNPQAKDGGSCGCGVSWEAKL